MCDIAADVDQIYEIGKTLYIVLSSKVEIFDREKKEFLKMDQVLSAFLKKEMEEHSGSYHSDAHKILFREGDVEGSLYAATESGLYYHVDGGSIMEKIINGNITDMGNPDIYVNFEVGMRGQDGMTEEDALKTFNTELMAGEGPDLILLDGMPIHSYTEKGILKDLTQSVEGVKKNNVFFDKILNTYQEEGEMCAVPLAFSVPLLFGKTENIDTITDLRTLTEKTEAIRQEESSGNIISVYNEEELLKKLYPYCAPAWMNGDGTLKQEELAEFLTLAARIWEVEKEGISESRIQEHQKQEQNYRENGNQD